MFMKLIEMYEEIYHHSKAEGIKKFSMREVVINPDYIVTIRADTILEKYLRDNPSFADGLQKEQKFTRISLNKGNSGQEVVVIGSLENITKLFDIGIKKVIKG